MISCNGEPYTLKGVSTVLRGDYANLLQKCDKAAFSYSTPRAAWSRSSARFPHKITSPTSS